MYRALIICNSKYEADPDLLSSLHGPSADGPLLTSALVDTERGYFADSDVDMLSDVPSDVMALEVNKFFNAGKPDDVLLLYFSGHGLFDDQQLYLCGTNTQIALLPATALANSVVAAILRKSKARARIVILDSCHSGAFKLKGEAVLDRKELVGKGIYLLAATSAYGPADDAKRGGRPSPFTEAVVAGLRVADRRGGNAGDLDVIDLFDYVKSALTGHPEPWLIVNANGSVPIARRPNAVPVIPPLPQPTMAPAAEGETSFLDAATAATKLDSQRVARFRSELRSSVLAVMPPQISDSEFLTRAHLMVGDALTRAGALLFGEFPTKVISSAIVQCAQVHGLNRDASMDTLHLRGTVPEQVVQARDFVAGLARRGDEPDENHAAAQPAYIYPMIAIREIIANALVHRDYENDNSCVHVRVYQDRIEVVNPGTWVGAGLLNGDTRSLGDLVGESRRPNFRLADALTWTKLVEGEGAGVWRAITECQRTGAPQPTVAYKDGLITVTIYPRDPSGRGRRRGPRTGTLSRELDPNVPVFFLSYAHPAVQPGLPARSRSSTSKILQFFEDLSTDVGELLGRDTAAYPGYMDRSMSGDERSRAEVCKALGTCQVFIPLVSPSLAGSDWCGKEWHAFSGREAEPRGVRLSDHRTAILPVIWAPFDMSAMPKVVSDVQMFSPADLVDFEIAETYQEEGLLGLLNLGWEQKYRSVVWRLAQQIVAVAESYEVKPSTPDPTRLRNVFKEKDR